MPATQVHNMDRVDSFLIEDPAPRKRDAGAVAYISGGEGGWFDREAAVEFISALTDLVEAHDTEEARKAEAAAKEAAKLKAGDKVRLRYVSDRTYTVVDDEGPSGLVRLVVTYGLRVGDLTHAQAASQFERVPE